jgi:ribosomal protein L11 methyltransferase
MGTSFADYFQYRITVINGPDIALEERQEIIISELSEMPFETFEIENDSILAYIRADLDQLEMMATIPLIEGVSKLEKKRIKGENWNKVWEESFEPITIENDVIVRAPFHVVDKSFKYEIIIEPKMSFGTGHHSTTRLMMETMLHLHFKNKSVLDMGCGTGILAILASKLGAIKLTAVDNDPVCVENTLENIEMNGCPHIEVFLNDKISANFKTDIILANIQKNVLIEQMPLYKQWLNPGGTLLVSGIYEESVQPVIESAKSNGLSYKVHQKLNEWCMIEFEN